MNNQSETVTVDSNDVLHVNKETLGIKASTFLYNLQQPTEKIDIAKYSKILIAIHISSHLVANTHAKQILEASSESEQEFFPSREQPSRQELFSSREQHSGSKPTQKRYKEEPYQTTDKEETVRRCDLSFPEVKKLDQFYLKGPASYGSIKRLQTQSKLPLGKIQSNLETMPSFTNYRSIRLKFPRLKDL